MSLTNRFFALLMALCASIPLHAQNYFSAQEIDENGRTRPLAAGRRTIDINSLIDITIDKDALRSHLSSQAETEQVDALIDRLKAYRALVEDMRANMDAYDNVLYQLKNVDLENDSLAREQYYAATQAISGVTLRILEHFEQTPGFEERLDQALTLSMGDERKSVADQYRLFLQLIDDETRGLQVLTDSIIETQGQYIQMAAFVINNAGITPVHLDGFDEIEQGQYYRYERSQLFLSEEQKAELDSLVNFFENESKNGSVFSKLSQLGIAAALQAVQYQLVEEKIAAVRAQIEYLKNQAILTTKKTTTVFDGLAADVAEIGSTVRLLKEKYTRPEGIPGTKTAVLEGFFSDWKSVADSIQMIGVKLEKIVEDQMTNLELLKKDGIATKDSLFEFSAFLSGHVNGIAAKAREVYEQATLGKTVNTAALEVSEKTLKLSISKTPEKTALNLKFTGERQPGDLVVLKILAGGPNDEEAETLQTQELPMMNVLPHVRSTVAYTFAKPVQAGQNFKGGPTYSILYKFKSRNMTYRNFMDVGIGLNASTYDFNNDDTPEIAGGVTVSLFRDYLQFGWGFNFNANTGYWHTGLRIPLPRSFEF